MHMHLEVDQGEVPVLKWNADAFRRDRPLPTMRKVNKQNRYDNTWQNAQSTAESYKGRNHANEMLGDSCSHGTFPAICCQGMSTQLSFMNHQVSAAH